MDLSAGRNTTYRFLLVLKVSGRQQGQEKFTPNHHLECLIKLGASAASAGSCTDNGSIDEFLASFPLDHYLPTLNAWN